MENNKIVEWLMEDIDAELKRISLVSAPATEEDFILFNSINLDFKTLNDEKRIVTGPAMVPDIHIPRKDSNGDLYYGFFSKETVRKAAEVFFKKASNTNYTNLEHQYEIEDVFVFESWIVDNPEMDKCKELGFSDVKEGTWMVSMKIDNDYVWENYLKTGLIKGFSVEVKADEKEVDKLSQIMDILRQDINEDNMVDEIVKVLKVK